MGNDAFEPSLSGMTPAQLGEVTKRLRNNDDAVYLLAQEVHRLLALQVSNQALIEKLQKELAAQGRAEEIMRRAATGDSGDWPVPVPQPPKHKRRRKCPDGWRVIPGGMAAFAPAVAWFTWKRAFGVASAAALAGSAVVAPSVIGGQPSVPPAWAAQLDYPHNDTLIHRHHAAGHGIAPAAPAKRRRYAHCKHDGDHDADDMPVLLTSGARRCRHHDRDVLTADPAHAPPASPSPLPSPDPVPSTPLPSPSPSATPPPPLPLPSPSLPVKLTKHKVCLEWLLGVCVRWKAVPG